MKKSVHKISGLFAFGILSIAALHAQNRKIEVWDFGGVQATGENIHNNITVADIDAVSTLGSNGRFTDPGDVKFGNLTINVVANDRWYFPTQAGKKAGDQGYQVFDFGDGYTSAGIYYCNGTGGEKRRYALISGVQAGDKVTFYAGTSNTSTKDIHFAHITKGKDPNIGTDILVLSGEQDEHAPILQAMPDARKYEYIATSSGMYKIFTDSSAGKPVFYRVVHTPGVAVSGNLSNLPKGSASLAFICRETNQQIPAKISGSSYSANLAPGYSYIALLSGIKGYGVTGATASVDLSKSVGGTKLSKALAIDEIKTYKADGTITGIAADYDVSKLKVVMTPPTNSVFQPVDMKTVKEGDSITFAGELEPNVRYTASLSGANDYEITSDTSFENTKAFTKNLTAAPKKLYDISGSFIGETSSIPQAVSFKNMEDGYVYSGTISGNTYTAQLRAGNYEIKAETKTAKTANHIVVTSKNVKKDINLVALKADTSALPLKKDIFVGGKKADYATVQEAVDAAARMAPKSEADRITIHIAPGVYRSQLTIAAPYITLKNDNPAKEVKLTWYYGIGYKYYSASATGYYDADLAHDKFSKYGVARWGGATFVLPSATAFRAEGITFETSFNKYLCDEEIEDGVEMDGSLNFERKYGSDVTSKAGTERATALLTEADKAEYIGCRFIGSQDTLYTGDNTTQYFRSCYIEGNTDFIFGGGNVVFEDTEINIAGYSEKASGAYLTAAREPTKGETIPYKGYLFYNCLISANNSMKLAPAFFGRPWGANAKVAFINSTFGSDQQELMTAEGWTQMSGNKPENAGFREFGSQWDGKNVNTKYRVANTTLKSADGFAPKDYLGDWKPAYFNSDKSAAGAKAKFSKKPSLSTNDDINTPYPGHTVTVWYEIKNVAIDDISDISWYRTKDGTKTLVKSSKGYADKSYLLTALDQNAQISVVVTPKLRNGQTGKAVEVALKAIVKEGSAIPRTVAKGGIRAEDKVNIFLAGDSTVTNYSENGMWSAGKNRAEGSWGEYLQAYFNETVAVQDYANGGRSTRNFINEGSLAKITEQMGKGDYLLIQFGHNDENLRDPDRGVILGKPDGKGIYPVTEGKKSATAAQFVKKYGDESYTETSGGTYKWFLKQYIDAARAKGATPILITPVSRLYFNADGSGKIRPHHDADGETPSDTYVAAVKQLAAEEKVALIDGFALTKALYEEAFKVSDNDVEARKLMTDGDSTHNSKIGGFIIAGLIARELKKAAPALSSALTNPKMVSGQSAKGEMLFTVNGSGKLSYDDEYWQKYGQALMDSFNKNSNAK